jgi:Ser/Thr protein kinase RdoA (MazF antagonist)
VLSDGEYALLDAWAIGPVISARLPGAGTINRTLLIDAASGGWVLRAYRHRDRTIVEQEHTVIAYARVSGLPAVAPLPLPGGATIAEQDGRFYALFPHAAGRQVERADLGAGEVAAMGRCLAALHCGLRGYPAERVRRRPFAVDRAAALARIARLEQTIRTLPTINVLDRQVLVALAGRRDWIEHAGATQPAGLAALDQQLIHGDYQQTNLFFDRGIVSAIIDWDQTYLAPPEWEIARTMHLVWNFAPGPCRTFLAAYRTALPLSDVALDLVATYYGWFRAHDLWLYEAIYFEGNDRVRAFVEPDGFVPLVDLWAVLRAEL